MSHIFNHKLQFSNDLSSKCKLIATRNTYVKYWLHHLYNF